jgi:serine/threonine kinase 38
LNIPKQEIEIIKKEILHKEAINRRLNRTKMTIKEFEPLSIIGKGAFGEVRVCRHKETNEIVAIKKLKKQEMCEKNQVLHVRTEKELLSEAKNEWIVDLKYSFQVGFELN